jgi:hypothetical protein
MQTRNPVYYVLTVVILLALLLGSAPITAAPPQSAARGLHLSDLSVVDGSEVEEARTPDEPSTEPATLSNNISPSWWPAVSDNARQPEYYISRDTLYTLHTTINNAPDAILESNQANAYMGGRESIAGVGDVNGDGYDDVIVVAYAYDNGQNNEGVAFVHHGGAGGVSATPAIILESNQANAWLGKVAGAGDVNGDGYADIILGARYYDNGQNDEGAAFVYHGGVGGIGATPAIILESNQANAQMGQGLAGAGDVNGDGYADVIVGAHRYDNGQNDEGVAFVYYGSAGGISATPAITLERNQAGAELGRRVAGAGDVNGDGYADVIVGVASYDNGENDEGVAFVYHGSADGLSATPAITLETNQANAYLGGSVAGAGDVNGDGYADVIVGANEYDNGQNNEGAAFVYHGGVGGIGATPAIILESNQAEARLGVDLAGAGDVNGDGYADVIVGVSRYDNGQNDEGVAFVYYGGPGGLNATPAVTLEADQAGAFFGHGATGAGDVNGDGYADVIVGALYYSNGQSNEGAAFVYHGGTVPVVQAGLDLNPDTFNLKSKGKWITAYIELPDDYDVADIDVGTVTLESTIAAADHPTKVGDYDDDGTTDLMVKFDRQALIEYLDGTIGEVTLTVSGELSDSTPFEGNDTITVINPGKK